MKPTYCIGIDPGLAGAIVTLDPQGRPTVELMPTLESAKGKPAYDLRRLSDLFVEVNRMVRAEGCLLFLTVERLQSMPAEMRGTMANYGRGRALGIIEAMATAHDVPYQLAVPQVWQKAMLAGVEGTDTKQRTVLAAQRLFPSVSLLRTPRSRKADHNIADALLLAEYGRRTCVGIK